MDKSPIVNAGISAEEAFATFSRSSVAMVLTNPALPDNPIVYVNQAFERMTGYTADAAIGRNCRFLQGPGTDPDDVTAIRHAIEAEDDIVVDILNYRSDGTPFHNRLLIAPILGDDGQTLFFLGIQRQLEQPSRRRKVSDDKAMREIQHRVKNHLAMVVSLIRVQSRSDDSSSESYSTLARRVESLQLLYEELTGPLSEAADRDVINLDAYLGRLASAIAHLDGRAGIAVGIDATAVEVPAESAARIGLIVSEVLTNAYQHAFVGQTRGKVGITVATEADDRIRIVIADDGVGFAEGVTWPDVNSLGGRIVLGLVDGLSGDLDVQTGPQGTTVTLTFDGDALET